MSNREIAEFIFGMVDMGVASELPEEEQIQYITDDLEEIEGTSLHYYLNHICERRKTHK